MKLRVLSSNGKHRPYQLFTDKFALASANIWFKLQAEFMHLRISKKYFAPIPIETADCAALGCVLLLSSMPALLHNDPALGSVSENSPWQASEMSSRRVSSVFIPGCSLLKSRERERVTWRGPSGRAGSRGLRWWRGVLGGIKVLSL